MPFIPKPQFPNVPQLPGVPQLRRSLLPEFAPGPPPALSGVIAVGRLLLAITSKPVWGIYKATAADLTPEPATEDGTLPEVVVRPPQPPVLEPDSFTRMQYEQESDLTTAPLQEGAFANYNKVASPYQLRLRMSKGGSLKDRQQFLSTLEDISRGIDLYRIVTPERIYIGCNISAFRIVREKENGAYWLGEVEISFVEIRQVQAQYSSTAENTANAKNPSALPTVNRGVLNVTPPATRVQTAINTALAPLRRVASIIGS